jgi:hypothetical protein
VHDATAGGRRQAPWPAGAPGAGASGNMRGVTDLPAHVEARALLGALVDHAALFPPAGLAMPDALAEDRRARETDDAWLLGRFVCPASRLPELLGATEGPPPISVVLDGDLDGGLAPAAAARGRGAAIEAVEARGLGPDAVRERVAALLGPDVPAYVEGAAPASLPAGVHAKLRCGGAAPEDVPPVGVVAAFVAECHDHGVAFKATAGLHHPVRHVDAATGVPQHGFLNLLAAALSAAVDGADADRLAGLLAIEEPTAVLAVLARFDADAAADVRAALFHGVGSCSFTEPVEDLRALGVLPA